MKLSLIKINSIGSLVKNWQFFLIGQGLFDAVVSGKFYLETRAATIRFQLRHRLQPEGIVGNKTRGMAMHLGLGAIYNPRTDISG